MVLIRDSEQLLTGSFLGPGDSLGVRGNAKSWFS